MWKQDTDDQHVYSYCTDVSLTVLSQTKMYLNVQNVLTKCNYNLQNTNVYYICKSITVPAYQEYTHSRSCSILNNLNDQDI